MKVNKYEEEQYVSLTKEAQHVLYLLYTIYFKNSKKHTKLSPCHYHFQNKEYGQHNSVNMYWD